MAYIDRTAPIGPAVAQPRSNASAPLKANSPSFGDALQRAGDGIQFSRHAQKRVVNTAVARARG